MQMREQQLKILNHFQNDGEMLTVNLIRILFAILSPTARVAELRKLGWDIRTNWTNEVDKFGGIHRVALYSYHGKKWDNASV